MKIVIDEKVCGKHHMTIPEFLVALSVRSTDNMAATLKELEDKEILICRNNQYTVTEPWSDIIDEILSDSIGGIDDEERLLNLAKAMRECFPEGKMPGTAFYYRCNNREVVLKLKKFFAQYGNYPDEKIVNACKRFVASYNGNYRYMPLIKYFISKNKIVQDEDGSNHVSEVSILADYLENKEEPIRVSTPTEDWLLSARN